MFYNHHNKGLQCWQIKLQPDNSVIIKSGYLSLNSTIKKHPFNDSDSAQEFYLKRLIEMNKEYNFVPWADELMIGVRVNKGHEPALDLVQYWDEIQEVIVYTQLDTMKVEVKDQECLESVYWIKTLVQETELTIRSIRHHMLKYGEADIMLIH
jgi:hypothetical protein